MVPKVSKIVADDKEWDFCIAEQPGASQSSTTKANSARSETSSRPLADRTASQSQLQQSPRDGKGKTKMTNTDGVVSVELEACLTPELQDCSECRGYHYATRCIYTLSWTQWLDYHAMYLSSLPYPIGEGVLCLDDLEHKVIRDRAREMDTYPNHRPNYLAASKMKADIMPQSSIEAYWEEEEWNGRLRRSSRYDLEKQRQLSAWKKTGGELSKDTGWGESAEEGSQDDLRTAVGRALLRTSLHTLFPPGHQLLPK